eukprot:6379438-Prorocentrum_lima.AAC.1
MEDTRHMLLPDEAPATTFLYMVAENLGFQPRTFDLWGWTLPRDGVPEVLWGSRATIAIQQRG